MKVIVDSIIYRMDTAYGIQNIYRELFPRMCNNDPSLDIQMLGDKRFVYTPPAHAQISQRLVLRAERYLRPNSFWEPVIPTANQLLKNLSVGLGKGWVWHSTYYTQPLVWKGWQVVTVYDMIYERFEKLFHQPYDSELRKRKKRCVQNADAIVCISYATAKDLQEFYDIDSDRIQVIYPAGGEVFRKLDRGYENDFQSLKRPFLLYVGARSIQYKNFDKLIRSYSAWSRKKDISMAVVGRPWSVEEERLLSKLNVLESVQLLSNVNDEMLCQLYNLAAALIYPSEYEGFGIPLLEAMACGCPIIASKIPSTLEVAGEYPVYFDLDDPDSLLASLETIINGWDPLQKKIGFERVKQFSWDKSARQMLDVYSALTGKKSG